MRCIYCSSNDSKVVDSRPTEDGWAIRRRRECIVCQKRFTTYEKVENPIVLVVKKDGRRESFSVEKIRHSVIRACEKRSVGMEQIDAIMARLERRIHNTLEQEISSRDIGELVLEELLKLDQVAYIRFASVHRQFKNIDDFIEAVHSMRNE